MRHLDGFICLNIEDILGISSQLLGSDGVYGAGTCGFKAERYPAMKATSIYPKAMIQKPWVRTFSTARELNTWMRQGINSFGGDGVAAHLHCLQIHQTFKDKHDETSYKLPLEQWVTFKLPATLCEHTEPNYKCGMKAVHCTLTNASGGRDRMEMKTPTKSVMRATKYSPAGSMKSKLLGHVTFASCI